jgi:non-specific serine/threonine protein kinase
VRQVLQQRQVATLRARLVGSAGLLEEAWSRGRGLSMAAAARFALDEDHASSSPPSATYVASPPPPQVVDVLTAREQEVAQLIAQGKTSKEIADALIITERTADTHAAHIRDKLGLRSRAEIAAWAVRQGLAAARET